MIESQIRYVAKAMELVERPGPTRWTSGERAGPVPVRDPAQAGQGRVDPGRLHELVPGR